MSILIHRSRRFVAFLGAALMSLLLLTPSVSFAQSPKIGYVNLQRALNEVEEGKKAKARLKRDFEKKQKKLNAQQEELKKLKAEIENAGPVVSQEVKRKKAMEFQQKLMALQQTYMTLQQELAKKEAKATKKIFDKMGKIIAEIAKEKGYDLVLERTESAVLYAKDNMDLTNELIKRYNK